MRPRTLGKIFIGVLTGSLLIVAFIYALESPKDITGYYKCFRAIAYAVMSLTCATLYRYFED